MLETIMKHGMILYVIGVLMAVGILAKIISYFASKRLVKAAGDIQKSNQRLMRLVKAKFEHASMVSDKVQNVEAFVQKYLYEYKVFGVRLETWRTFSVKMSWMMMVFGFLGVLLGYREKMPAEELFRYGVFASVCAVILISIHILSDEKTKVLAAKNYMVEYLENVCARRYEKANQMVRPVQEDEVEKALAEVNETEEEMKEEMKAEMQAEIKEETVEEDIQEIELQLVKEEQASSGEDEQQIRFRAILEEFLA